MSVSEHDHATKVAAEAAIKDAFSVDKDSQGKLRVHAGASLNNLAGQVIRRLKLLLGSKQAVQDHFQLLSQKRLFKRENGRKLRELIVAILEHLRSVKRLNRASNGAWTLEAETAS